MNASDFTRARGSHMALVDSNKDGGIALIKSDSFLALISLTTNLFCSH